MVHSFSYQTANMPAGCGLIRGPHLHLDGAGQQATRDFVDLLERECGCPGKARSVQESLAGPQRRTAAEVYAAHTPTDAVGNETFGVFSTSLLGNDPQLISRAISEVALPKLCTLESGVIEVELTEMTLQGLDIDEVVTGGAIESSAPSLNVLAPPGVQWLDFSSSGALFEIHHILDIPAEFAPSLGEMGRWLEGAGLTFGGLFSFFSPDGHILKLRSNSFFDGSNVERVMRAGHGAIAAAVRSALPSVDGATLKSIAERLIGLGHRSD